MNEKEHRHNQQDMQKQKNEYHNHRPYWKSAHRDWRVWVGVILMLGAIFYYIMSEDFAFSPRKQQNPPTENNRTP